MSAPAEAAIAFTPAPAPEVAATDNPDNAHPAMSLSLILNPSAASDVKGLPSPPPASAPAPAPTASTPAPATAPGTPADDVGMEDLALDPPASPAPSTGDVELKTDGDVENNGAVGESFKCMNDEFEECRTGQTTMDLSRKVISDHFGRNKACTRLITDWPLFCRKHYQRATYNQKLWQTRKITLVLRQFSIIQDQFPGTKYTVALKKSEEQRLNTYSRKVASGMSEEEAAAVVAPGDNRHFEAPVNVLRELNDFLGENKSKPEVEYVVNVIKDMLEKEDCDQVPSIEFLPQLDAEGNPFDISKTPKNAGRTPKKASRSPKKASASRTNKKGGVAKTTPGKKTPPGTKA